MKKAQWTDIRKALLTVIILAIIIGFIIMKFILNPTSSIQTGVLSPQAKEWCKAEMDKQYPPTDTDVNGAGDGFPDYVQRMGVWCDSCLGGDDNVDSDGDGIPDACDKHPNTPMDSKSSIDKECNVWNKDVKRCFVDATTENNYISKYSKT